MLKHPVFLVFLGFLLGLGAQYFVPKSAPEISVQQSPVTQNETPVPDQTPTPATTDTNTNAPEKNCPLPTASESQPEVPCPCLFSNEILNPPEYLPELPEELVTNFDGEAIVRWKEVIGAKRYQVAILTEAGEMLKFYKTSRTLLYLKDIPLPRGKYEAHYIVKLASMNGKDEVGPLGPAKKLYVKPMATIVAPEVQEIKVED